MATKRWLYTIETSHKGLNSILNLIESFGERGKASTIVTAYEKTSNEI